MRSKERGSAAFTVGVSSESSDLFDFGSRAAMVNRRKRKLGIPASRPLPAPWTLAIEPMMACNAQCNFCAFADTREIMRRDEHTRLQTGLPVDVVDDALAFARENGTRGTYWSGGGEPSLWPHFDRAVSRCAAFSRVFLQTNGILLHRSTSTIDDLARFRVISVSVVADSSALHEAIGMNSFDRIINNILQAVNLKILGHVDVQINAKVIVTRENHTHLPNIVRYYESLGVDSISLRMAQDYAASAAGAMPPPSHELTADERSAATRIIDGSTYAHPSLIAFRRTLALDRDAVITPASACHAARDGHIAYITASGAVYVGTPEMVHETLAIGNVLDTPFADLWGGPRHLAVIDEMDRQQRAGTCPLHLCRHVKANQGVDDDRAGRMRTLDETAVMAHMGAFL